MASRRLALFAALVIACAGCKKNNYDTIIRNGMIYDGSGNAPFAGDVGLRGDTIAFIGDLANAKANLVIDAKGKAVAPGFINMLSWATESLLIDGHSQSDIRQGVTLEVMGEGQSMGPLNDRMATEMQHDIVRAGEKFKVTWKRLDEYLRHLEENGISTNVSSFVGAETVRVHEIGKENRRATPEEMLRMKELVRTAMREGALGVGSSLIYAPGNYAPTDELIELCKTAAEYNGMYITHMRSEGNDIIKALNEAITIAREAHVPAEIYHLKLAGKDNWNKLDTVTAMIDRANKEGLHISADMYTYDAGATGLDASMPPWIQEGGIGDWIKRMKDPVLRTRALKEMSAKPIGWENLMRLAGSPDRIILVDFVTDSLKKYTGKTLTEVAKLHGKSPEETAMDLVIADSTRVGTIYRLMDESNIRRQLMLPYVSFGSDASSLAPEGSFIKSNVHPRAYGNFARLFAKYIREEKIMSVAEAVHRLSGLPASHLNIAKRGSLTVGYFADIVVFDPETIQDHATFEKPHAYSTGVNEVFVNGVSVLHEGNHTGATPGKVVRGKGAEAQ